MYSELVQGSYDTNGFVLSRFVRSASVINPSSRRFNMYNNAHVNLAHTGVNVLLDGGEQAQPERDF